jgi:hypothetical protein
LKRRLQASGYRHQGSGYETRVALADTKSDGEALSPYLMVPEAPTPVANGPENLKSETCSLMPPAKAYS